MRQTYSVRTLIRFGKFKLILKKRDVIIVYYRYFSKVCPYKYHSQDGITKFYQTKDSGLEDIILWTSRNMWEGEKCMGKICRGFV